MELWGEFLSQCTQRLKIGNRAWTSRQTTAASDHCSENSSESVCTAGFILLVFAEYQIRPDFQIIYGVTDYACRPLKI